MVAPMVDDKKLPRPDDDDDARAGDDAERDGEGRSAGKSIGDMARRALMSGIGAVFMSEETLRQQLSEMKLGKDAVGYVVGQADKTKREIIDVVARETRAFLSRLEVEKMVGRMLMGTTIEVQTRIRILPNAEGNVGVAIDKNEATFVKTEEPAAPTPPAEEKPRKAPTSRRRAERRTDDNDDDG
jgi:hypothetical protein